MKELRCTAALLIAIGLSGCSDGGDGDAVFNPYAGYRSARYSADALWLCRPGLAADQCIANDLSATEIRPDGSLQREPIPALAGEPEIDCFYVYPTVDLSGEPGNHTDFSDIRPMLDPLLSQAARFQYNCRVFAPLYRQGTIGSFGAPDQEAIFALAYSDVEDAFRHYMGQYNEGRDFVIMGHSQGTGMTEQLIQNEIDAVPGLRQRLVVALLIGGSVWVPDGAVVGGSFQNVPLCTAAEQTGCVIAYRSYAAGYAPTNNSNDAGPEGADTACVNPAAEAGGKAVVDRSYFPLNLHQPLFDVRDPSIVIPPLETEWVVYPRFYAAECVRDAFNNSYLEISLAGDPGDVRQNPILFSHPVLAPSFLGTHVVDYNFVLSDLITAVFVKAQRMRP